MSKPIESFDVIVVGAGIVGLAHAWHAARRGLRVALLERSSFAVGASVRNFGLLWPIGQPAGPLLQRALRARSHWLALREAAQLAIEDSGSLHVARHRSELAVLEEFYETQREQGYEIELLSAAEARRRSPQLRSPGLLGALASNTELTASSPLVIRRLAHYLAEELKVDLRFDCAVTAVEPGRVQTEQGDLRADHIFCCTGADLQALTPETLKGVTLCKLQMLSVAPTQPAFRLGPALCAGLTLLHYDAFATMKSLTGLQLRADEVYPKQRQWGIHVLVSQHSNGELILGDSHEYARTLEPFDREVINQAILDYLDEFFRLPPHRVARRWHGIYPKLKGHTELVADPAKGVTVVNALSGAGMTLALGLAEEVTEQKL